MTHVHPDVCRIWAGCETNRSGLLINWREELSFRSVYAARRSVQYQKGVTNTRAPSVDPLSPSVQQKWHTHTQRYIAGIRKRQQVTGHCSIFISEVRQPFVVSSKSCSHLRGGESSWPPCTEMFYFLFVLFLNWFWDSIQLSFSLYCKMKTRQQ